MGKCKAIKTFTTKAEGWDDETFCFILTNEYQFTIDNYGNYSVKNRGIYLIFTEEEFNRYFKTI